MRFELRTHIHPPRQGLATIGFRLPRQLRAASESGHLRCLSAGTHSDHHQGAPGSRSIAVNARIARLRAPRRPYRRTHIDVKTSIMSRTKSSVLSPGSATTIQRPCAESAACRCSTPNRANRSRCSTTITFASGSDTLPTRGPLTVQPNLGDDLPHRQFRPARPRRQPGNLAVQTHPLRGLPAASLHDTSGKRYAGSHTSRLRPIRQTHRRNQNTPTHTKTHNSSQPLGVGDLGEIAYFAVIDTVAPQGGMMRQ